MYFKKPISVLLAVYLLVAASGLAFNVHYCGGELASVTSIFAFEEPCEVVSLTDSTSCCSSGEADHMGCCSDERVQADFDEMLRSQINLDFSFTALFAAYPLPCLTEFVGHTSQKQGHYCCDSNAPPLYKLYTQFVFYA